MLAIDNDKQPVAGESIGCFGGRVGTAAEGPDESGDGPWPKHLSVAKIP